MEHDLFAVPTGGWNEQIAGNSSLALGQGGLWGTDPIVSLVKQVDLWAHEWYQEDLVRSGGGIFGALE